MQRLDGGSAVPSCNSGTRATAYAPT